MRIKISPLLALIFITSCTTAPGSHVPASSFSTLLQGAHDERELKVSRILITPEIVNRSINVGQDFELPPTWSTSKDGYSYKILPGDQLSVVVWDHPELTAPYGSFNNAQEQGNVVREDGTIYYPFVGSVQAAENRPRDSGGA